MKIFYKNIIILPLILFSVYSCSEQKYNDTISHQENKELSKNLSVSVYVDDSESMKELVNSSAPSGCEHETLESTKTNNNVYSPYKKLLCNSLTRAIEKTWSRSNGTKIKFYKLDDNEITNISTTLKQDFYKNKLSDVQGVIEKKFNKDVVSKNATPESKTEQKLVEEKNSKKDELSILVTDFAEANLLDKLGSSLLGIYNKNIDIGVFCIKDRTVIGYEKKGKPFYLLVIGNALDIKTFSDNLKTKELDISDLNTSNSSLHGFIYIISKLFSKKEPIISSFEYKQDTETDLKNTTQDSKNTFMETKNQNSVEIKIKSKVKIFDFITDLTYDKLEWTPFSYLIEEKTDSERLKKEEKISFENKFKSFFDIISESKISEYSLVSKSFDKNIENTDIVSIDDYTFLSESKIRIKGKIKFENLPKNISVSSLHKFNIISKIKLKNKDKAIPKFLELWEDHDMDFTKTLLKDIVTNDSYTPVVSNFYLYIKK